MSKTIVLIHGNFVNPTCWADWLPRLQARGYTVHAPPNPGHGGDPAALRDSPHPDLADTGITEVVENMAAFLEGLPEKPILIGHSLGGLATLKLVEMEKCVAAVSLHGAPPKNGPFAPLQTLKAVLPALGLFTRGRTWMGSQAWFDQTFFTQLPKEARAEVYAKFAVRESKKAIWSGLAQPFANIDFAKPHVPLLFVGGTADQIFPAPFIQKIAGCYEPESGRLVLEIFVGRSHFTAGEPGWEAVADHILDWLESL